MKDNNAIPVSVKALRSGLSVIYPTETCYGLGADASSRKAVRKIFRIKNRQTRKKISVAYSDIDMAKKYIDIDRNTGKIIKKFMPGPLTIIKNGTGFRIPKNAFARRLIRTFGKPITATSANQSGEKPVYEINKIIKLFNGKVSVIIDAGNLPKKKVSTVFDADSMCILRRGAVTKKEIMRALA